MSGPSHTPGTNGWFDAVERRLQTMEEDVGYLMHPESGVHARITEVKSSLKSWSIALLTALLLNLMGVIVAITLLKGQN